MKNIILKGTTLILFVILFLGYVFYKAGFFKDRITNFSDKNYKKDSTKTIQIMSSSKLVVLKEKEIKAYTSSKLEIDTFLIKNIIFSSSKSGIILKPEELNIDSIVANSLKKND